MSYLQFHANLHHKYEDSTSNFASCHQLKRKQKDSKKSNVISKRGAKKEMKIIFLKAFNSSTKECQV